MLDDTFKVILEEGASRRAFLRNSGVGLAGIGAAVAGGALSSPAEARPRVEAANGLTDNDIFNFALNFEYLGAEYYLAAIGAPGLPTSLTTSTNGKTSGGVTLPTTNTAVPFQSQALFDFAEQLAVDEYAHVASIRELVTNAIAEPAIELDLSWTTLAAAAGLIGPGQTFNPFASEVGFLLGAYVLEDVCVTALCGAASLVKSKTNLSYAASILGVESYQIGMIRQRLSAIGGGAATNAISALRSTLANKVINVGTDDFGTDANGNAFNFTNNDVNGQAFRRSFTQILAIAYGTNVGANGSAPATSGGFFPQGVNGPIFATQ